jgi:hypothetical protein
MPKRIKLSFSNFEALLNKHVVYLTSVCVVDNEVRFLICRTPTHQKSFVVRIPPKYIMMCEDETCQKIAIQSSSDTFKAHQINFLADMKGLQSFDIFVVSPTEFLFYSESNSEYYSLAEESHAEDTEEEEEEDEITQLEKKVKQISGKDLPKIRKEESPPEEPQSENPQEESQSENPQEESQALKNEDDIASHEDSEKTAPEENGEEHIELIFETEDGEPYDSMKEQLNKEVGGDEGQEDEGQEDEDDDEEYGMESRNNDMPDTLGESDISLGCVYVCLDIGQFFSEAKSKTLESYILNSYKDLDKNESSYRTSQISKIKEKAQQIATSADSYLSLIDQRERELKNQLLRSTVILAQVRSMLEKLDPKEKKLRIETELIHVKTEKTIHEINLELMRTRDRLMEYIGNATSLLSETLDL